MRTLSPQRRLSLTKNTRYASVARERVPLEVGQGASASNRNVEKELDKNQIGLAKIHRKSLIHMDSQRKLLERSMLAYSKKMKDISDSRTTDLFMDIHARIPTCKAKSLNMSLDTNENLLVPVNSAKLRQRKWHGSLSDINTVGRYIYSPIVESNDTSNTTDETIIRKPRIFIRRSSSADNLNNKHTSKHTTDTATYDTAKGIKIVPEIIVVTDAETDVTSVHRSSDEISLSPSDRTNRAYFSDSAYSSCTDDDISSAETSRCGSLSSLQSSSISNKPSRSHRLNKQKKDMSIESSDTDNGNDTKTLLKLPTIHLRRRNKTSKHQPLTPS